MLDRGKRHRLKTIHHRQLQRLLVAGSKNFRSAPCCRSTQDPAGVNDALCFEAISRRDARMAWRATAETLTLSQQPRARGCMNGAVHSAAAQQRRIGGIDDSIDSKRSDVRLHLVRNMAAIHPSLVYRRQTRNAPSDEKSANKAGSGCKNRTAACASLCITMRRWLGRVRRLRLSRHVDGHDAEWTSFETHLVESMPADFRSQAPRRRETLESPSIGTCTRRHHHRWQASPASACRRTYRGGKPDAGASRECWMPRGR